MPKIKPNLDIKRFGLGGGWITISPDGVSITVCPGDNQPELLPGHDDFDDSVDTTFMLSPESAPLFRMIANRLDELAGVRKPRPRA